MSYFVSIGIYTIQNGASSHSVPSRRGPENLAPSTFLGLGRFSAVFRLDGALPPTRSLWNSVEVASTDPDHGPEANLLLNHGGPDFFSTF